MGRLVTADEVAHAITYLASPLFFVDHRDPAGRRRRLWPISGSRPGPEAAGSSSKGHAAIHEVVRAGHVRGAR
jgi:hypothetical protein